MFEVGTATALASSLSHRREYTEEQLEQAIADYEYWQRSQVLYGVGVTALIKISEGWLVVACPELVEKVIGF